MWCWLQAQIRIAAVGCFSSTQVRSCAHMFLAFAVWKAGSALACGFGSNRRRDVGSPGTGSHGRLRQNDAFVHVLVKRGQFPIWHSGDKYEHR